MPLVSKDEIIKDAQMLNSRSQYAGKINKILQTVYDKNVNQLRQWDQSREHRKEFLAEYKRLLIRSLLTELSAIFDKHSDRNEKYCLLSLLKSIDLYINNPDVHENLFPVATELLEADFNGFLIIHPTYIDADKIDDLYALKILNEEWEAFQNKNKSHIDGLKYLRDKFLAHLDRDYEAQNTDVSFLVEASEWIYCYVNLVVNLMVRHGARHYVASVRAQLLGRVETLYDEFTAELTEN
jgi:hypothetical protein